MRPFVAFERFRHGLFDFLRRERFEIAQRDVVVLAHQQVQDVDIIVPRARTIDQETRARPLTQRIVHILGIVGKHAERAVSTHDRVGTGKALHQHSGNLQLPCTGLPIPAFARQLVDVINRAKADHIRVNHVVEKRLGILRRFALIAVDAVRRQVLIPERIARRFAIAMDQPSHHLDQRGFTRARHAIAHEGKDETTQFGKRVQFPVKIIGHQHLGQLHRLIFGNVVAHDLVRLFKAHGQLAATCCARGGEAGNRQIIRLDPEIVCRKRRQARRGLGPQSHLFHQLFSEGHDGRHQLFVRIRKGGDFLVQLP